ncbi:sensor histidine kinase [Thiohalomonas denitrificans]|uniref:histidine kinase n=1 Tax=Thiohalomonas denitrificans TaxID=415747 RepID=A0A1G5PHY2_9GAMM|nr:HAMP domain-containing sensor histidine kinase [Thiohalomonas denitrificans]SCZ49113.1 PAS domain S-box-containing protein [Thiohalomonas denitrificans]
MAHRQFPTLVRYGLIIPALLLAGLLRLALDPALGFYGPITTFFGVSMVVAWYGGRGPALLTLLLGALAAAYLFMPPRGSFSAAPGQWLGVTLYLAINFVVVLLVVYLKSSKESAELNDFRFRRLLEAGNVGIALADSTGHIRHANPVLLNMLGYTPAEVEAGELRWDRLTPPEFTEITLAALRQVDSDGLPFGPYEKEYITRSGGRIPVLIGLVPFERTPDGPLTGAIFVIDLSPMKEVEKQLRLQEARMHIAAQTAGFGSFDLNLETGEEYWSPEIKKLFGLPPEAAVALEADRLPIAFHPDDHKDVLQAVQTAMDPNGFGEMQAEHRILQPGGKEIWVLNRSKVVFAGEGANRHPVRHIGALIDIDERKRLEEALRANEARLKRANAELEQFAYVTSHDLKAPLRSVHGLSTWIEEETAPHLSRDGRRHMQLLRDRVAYMDQLLNSLLEYSRAGGQVSELKSVATADLIEEIIAEIEHPPEFRVEIVSEMPRFTTDAFHLHQVFRQLLDNAVKHHDRRDGRVALSARDLGAAYEFTVTDDGPGIPGECQEWVFNLFRQGPDAPNSTGTGVGLTVVKKVVENIGGDIRLESSPGEGTTFRFTWPKQIPINGSCPPTRSSDEIPA